MTETSSSYYDPNIFTYLNGSNTIATQLSNPSGSSWAQNQNCLDSKQFNNANYVALFIVSHFRIGVLARNSTCMM
ncbi:hypothetical protein NXV35_25410 [Bacteroides faecis]|nr:hypothetical protein [Bacteroides faecis]